MPPSCRRLLIRYRAKTEDSTENPLVDAYAFDFLQQQFQGVPTDKP